MAEERRHRLQVLLEYRTEQTPDVSRMSLICALGVSELGVSGVGATVLSQVGDGDGDGHVASGNGGGRGHRRGLVHATNEVSAGLEDLQLTVGEGPCLDAFESGGPVLIPDLAAEVNRWPGFTPSARELGAAAVFSFPMQIGVIRLGSMDLYRDEGGPLSTTQVTDALILTDLATGAVMEELDGHATDDLAWLADSHAQVHQASGMVQVQLNSSTPHALLRLRAHAYTHELSLADVAGQVVDRTLRFTTDA